MPGVSSPRGAGLLQRRAPGQVLERDLQADALFGIDRLAGRAGMRDWRAGPVSVRHDLTPVQAELLCALLAGPRGWPSWRAASAWRRPRSPASSTGQRRGRRGTQPPRLAAGRTGPRALPQHHSRDHRQLPELPPGSLLTDRTPFFIPNGGGASPGTLGVRREDPTAPWSYHCSVISPFTDSTLLLVYGNTGR